MERLPEGVRERSYGQGGAPSVVDRFGVWLSGAQIRRHVPSFSGVRLGDFGCGYEAVFVRSVLGDLGQAVLADVSLAPDLKAHPKVLCLEGPLPDVLHPLEERSLDVVMCISVLEHLWDPLAALSAFRRLLAPNGVGLFNVPSWRGKRFLELSAFRLGLSPAEEMDDHKAYYDPRDLWPLLVRAGFKPHNIRCTTHKFGLNTFAVCRVD